MTLKEQILIVGHKLSNRCTILAISSSTEEQYKLIGIENGKAILEPTYGAMKIEPIDLDVLYRDYHDISESKSTVSL